MNDLMARVEQGRQNQSFGRLLGLKVEDAQEGRVVISCQKRDDLTGSWAALRALRQQALSQ